MLSCLSVFLALVAPSGPLTTAIGYGFPLGKPSEPLTVPRTRLRSLTARAECSDLQRLRPLYDLGIWQNDPPGFTTSFDAYNTSDVLRGPLGLSLGAGDQIVVAAASFNNLTGSNSQERIRFGNFDPPGFSSSFSSILPMPMLTDSDEHALVRIPSILLNSMTGSYAACQHDSCECTHLDHEKINAPGVLCLPAFDLDGDYSDLSIVSGLPAADPLDPSYCGYAARFVNHLTHGNLNGTMQTAHLFLAVAVRLADHYGLSNVVGDFMESILTRPSPCTGRRSQCYHAVVISKSLSYLSCWDLNDIMLQLAIYAANCDITRDYKGNDSKRDRAHRRMLARRAARPRSHRMVLRYYLPSRATLWRKTSLWATPPPSPATSRAS